MRLVFAALVLSSLAVLGGCNGEEDFSDSLLTGDVLGLSDQQGGSSSFTADSPAKIGNLITPLVSNIKYRCGGVDGVIGKTGNLEDDAALRYRCPTGSTNIQFYLGSSTRRIILGRAWFRNSTDADLLQLTPLDLFISPARLDADALEADPAINLASLLRALDADDTTMEVEIAEAVHCVIGRGDFSMPDNNARFYDQRLDKAPADFRADFDPLLAMVQAEDPGDCPFGDADGSITEAVVDLREALKENANRALAGLYFIDTFTLGSAGSGIPLLQDFYDGMTGAHLFETLYTETYLPFYWDVMGKKTDDPVEANQLLNQMPAARPLIFIDRSGRVWGGGAYWHSKVVNQESASQFIFDGEFVALEAGASFDSRAVMQGVALEGASGTSSFTVDGRLFGPWLLPDFAGASGTSNGDWKDAFKQEYPRHDYAGGRQAGDFALINGTAFGNQIKFDQIYKGEKSVSVVPYLDQTQMDTLFGPDGKEFTFSFLRADPADEDLTLVYDQPRGGDLGVVINPAGEIFIDVDTSCTVTAGDHVIGMVASINPPDAQNINPTVNIVISALGPIANQPDIPNYGVLFIGRLDPSDGRFFATGDQAFVDEEPVFWFDTYSFVEGYHSNYDEMNENPVNTALQGTDVFNIAGKTAATLEGDCVP